MVWLLTNCLNQNDGDLCPTMQVVLKEGVHYINAALQYARMQFTIWEWEERRHYRKANR
jgi:hypothetical protein